MSAALKAFNSVIPYCSASSWMICKYDFMRQITAHLQLTVKMLRHISYQQQEVAFGYDPKQLPIAIEFDAFISN